MKPYDYFGFLLITDGVLFRDKIYYIAKGRKRTFFEYMHISCLKRVAIVLNKTLIPDAFKPFIL